MNGSEFFSKTTKVASDYIGVIAAGDWDKQSPCEDWSLRMLVSHMVDELLWIPPLLTGETVASVGNRFDGDILGDHPKQAWKDACSEAKAAIAKADLKNTTVQLSYGRSKAEKYITEVAGDIFIHSWDVAKTLDNKVALDLELIEFMYDSVKEHASTLAATGLFAKPIKTSAQADTQTKLLALFGRKN